ncbi:putative anthocyanidin 3-O-glucoside 2''-O-glucosyltransferase [Lupinus albus]|uniref:Putative anthocyanidin 3-O-glucoside 2''-O-glucosyltransferase n=1 Tax=Lupinus albus TaxID=3870 RepID=A0A6A4NBR7_LUPAL|nr:putative anthocyanidin 3-O-glucoside 2''-O-glucosyltransferase [Lupinus albus]
MTKSLGLKSLLYFILYPLSKAYFGVGPRQIIGNSLSEDDLNEPPPGFPDSYEFHAHEPRFLPTSSKLEFGSGVFIL